MAKNGNNVQADTYAYVIDETLNATTTETPDVRIDDADFECRGISTRAQLAALHSLGTCIIGTPLLRVPGQTSSSNTFTPSGLVLARLNINGAWTHSEPVPIDVLGSYAPGDETFLAQPFVIPARSTVYAEITNNSGEQVRVFITLHGRKLFS